MSSTSSAWDDFGVSVVGVACVVDSVDLCDATVVVASGVAVDPGSVDSSNVIAVAGVGVAVFTGFSIAFWFLVAGGSIAAFSRGGVHSTLI
ncbi:Hypothetical predicted protein [Octopus vulgaris]|uniref:Uncharacterized protein n=1 Tax=Octopus vulgaris TaxID=6645 RepID=A0AA36FGJ4_OCTVU|nr:Hypothetical predicted protein [Octopus vulgaris]